MKTPKAPSVQFKIKTTKHGMIRKSSGSTPARILKSAIKGKENGLSILKDTEELVKLVKKKSPKRVKMSPSSLFKKTVSGDFKKETFPRTPKPKDFKNSQTIFKTYTSEIENRSEAKSTPQKGKLKKFKFKETEHKSNFKKGSVSTDESCVKRSELRKKKKKIDSLDDSSDQLSSMSFNMKRKSEFTEVKGKKKRKLKVAKTTEKEDRSEDEGEEGSEKGEERLAQLETHGALFNLNNIKNGVEALLKLQSKHKKAGRGLFEEEQFVYLQVMLDSIAAGPGISHRIPVPHSILPENPDICLLTPDLRGKKNDPEEAIDFYQEVLRRNNITSVTEVIPLRKFKKEYSQYEEQRKFRNRFDLFLVDTSIQKIVTKFLTKSSKCIVVVRPCDKKKKLKSQIEKAVGRVPLHISGNGRTLSIKCGRLGMPVEHLVDNIVEIGKFLSADKPIIGGRRNINSVYLKDAKSPAIPVYVNLDTTVVPPPAARTSSQPQPVRGELTTINGASIIVFPSGRVKVIKNKSDKTEAKTKKGKENKKKNQQKDSSDEDLDGSKDEKDEEDIDDNTEDGEESSAEDEDGAENKGGESEEEEEGVESEEEEGTKSEEDESEDEEEVKIGEVQSENDDEEVDSEEEGEECEDEEKKDEQSEEEAESEDKRAGMKYFNGKLKKHQLQNKKTEFVKSNKNMSSSAKHQKSLKLKNKNIKQR